MESDMEISTHECPTGILVSFEEQENHPKPSSFATLISSIKGLADSNKDTSKDNKKNCEKEKITLNCEPSNLWAVNNIPDHYPRTPRKNLLRTPKTNWRTPSPKSMKIISRDASQIVDRLYSSPLLMSSSEILLCDEIFPATKSFDGLSYEEVSVKSENLSAKDTNLISKQVPSHDSQLVNKKFQEEPDSLDMTKCCITSAKENGHVSPECTVMADAKNSTILLESEMIYESKCNSTMEEFNKNDPLVNDENPSDGELTVGSNFNDGGTIKKIEETVSIDKQMPAVPESIVQLDAVHSTPTRSLARCVRSTLNAVKGFGFKSAIKHVEKDKENTFQQIGNKPVICGSRLSKVEKSVSVQDELQGKLGKSQVSRKKSIEQSSMKRISCATAINEKKDKSALHLGQDNHPEEVTIKANVLPSKSTFVQYRQLPCKKPLPLGKSASTETPSISKPVRRSNSFQTGSAKFSIPTVGKPVPSGIGLKPRMSLSRMSLNGTGLSTPLKCGPSSQKFPSTKSLATNPNRRISQITRPSTLTDVKPAAQKYQHSALNKNLISTSNGKRFSSRLDLPSPLPKFMNDNLPRKLF